MIPIVIPLDLISRGENTSRLQDMVFERLKKGVSPQVKDTVCAGLVELVDNVNEHAHSQGVMAAQVFRPDQSGNARRIMEIGPGGPREIEARQDSVPTLTGTIVNIRVPCRP